MVRSRILLSFRACATCIARGNHGRVAPQSLELVKIPKFRMKHVDHEIHVVQQDPTSLGQSFHMMGLETGGGGGRHEMVRPPPRKGVLRSRHPPEKSAGGAQAA